MTRRFTFLIAAAALCAAAPAAAEAAKPTPTGSTAPAQVFFPNPVQSLADESLTDQKDANYPALAAGYERKTLTNLDGSGTLTGDYAKVISETGTPARDTGSGFVYTRDQDQFEQVMGYYWITEAQRYIQFARVRQHAAAGQQAPAAAADRPVRRRQLVPSRRVQEAHDHARQGRRRRRRGRRGDRARVRPLGAGRPGSRLRLLAGRRRDRRGVRRLPRRHRRARSDRRDVPGSVRRRLGLGVVHGRRRDPLPASAR